MRQFEILCSRCGKRKRVRIDNLVRIADEENYDRDSFVTAAADVFSTMAAISTFNHYGEEAQEDSHEN